MLQKIDIDSISLKEIITVIQNNKDAIFVFYNNQFGYRLNKQLIFSLIFYLAKYYPKVSYYFYNIPFCVLKSLGKIYINEHCIKNKLCNQYEGYVTYHKCNRCTFGLFCNNINSKILDAEVLDLEGFYDDEFIKKEELFDKIYNFYNFLYGLGFQESEVSFYVTQKYMVDFLLGDFEIAKEYLQYFTVYFLLDNPRLLKKYFLNKKSSSLVFSDRTIEEKLIELVKDLGININFVHGKEDTSIQELFYKKTIMRLNYYYSVDIYRGKRDFFDFKEIDIGSRHDISVFKGVVINKKELILKTNVWLMKKAGDLYSGNSDVYIGRDMISGLNINNYKGILLTSDNLGEKGRLYQSLGSIEIPVIYNISPNIMEILRNGDMIEIDFNKGIIQKCN